MKGPSASKGPSGKHVRQPTKSPSPSPTSSPKPTASPSPTTSPTASPSSTASPTTSPTSPALTGPVERSFTVTRSGTQLVQPYCSNGDLTQTRSQITTVVFVVHGSSRTACDQVRYVSEAASDRGVASSTLVVAPHFLTTEDAAAAEPRALYWSDSGWKAGSQSLTSPYPRATTASSFSVLDDLVEAARSEALLPNLESLVVAGHSAGGQFVNRYAATTHLGVTGAPITPHFVVANPSSYLYFDSRRPTPAGWRQLSTAEVDACSWFNTYKYGLAGLNAYASASTVPLASQYASARVTYLLGALDNDPAVARPRHHVCRRVAGTQQVRARAVLLRLARAVARRRGVPTARPDGRPRRRALVARHVHVT